MFGVVSLSSGSSIASRFLESRETSFRIIRQPSVASWHETQTRKHFRGTNELDGPWRMSGSLFAFRFEGRAFFPVLCCIPFDTFQIVDRPSRVNHSSPNFSPQRGCSRRDWRRATIKTCAQSTALWRVLHITEAHSLDRWARAHVAQTILCTLLLFFQVKSASCTAVPQSSTGNQ